MTDRTAVREGRAHGAFLHSWSIKLRLAWWHLTHSWHRRRSLRGPPRRLGHTVGLCKVPKVPRSEKRPPKEPKEGLPSLVKCVGRIATWNSQVPIIKHGVIKRCPPAREWAKLRAPVPCRWGRDSLTDLHSRVERFTQHPKRSGRQGQVPRVTLCSLPVASIDSSRLLRNDRDVMIGLLLHLLKFSPVSLDPRSLWDNAVSFKQKERLDRLARILNDSNDFSQINAFDLTVLSTPAHEIVARIGARRLNWNARNVTKAFIKAAIQAHAETNCLTEIMFEEALERADQMDKEFAATGQLKGRLHGIPVSLKDQVNVKGFDSTIGFSKFVNQPAGENAPVVDRLVEEGAIPFTKTNVPQSLFSFECSNPVFGHTHNPHKRGFTCGGSSGGEAALLASDGSCLGIGGKSANSGALLRVLQPETVQRAHSPRWFQRLR
ncbi:hypothetical protein PSTG_04258 [Puccinia striiformis f. sp. tritici PST-78]|uniref:Amidase domain-containing protein n=1 Tax=Puccinia striiformis f. sp. tritici PST-78 TaxID=1165861 RepID=A0A0L0VTR2_9BASI|nr:hypothetical protein PSTG_04258 [Puccinia striiformis f. sp. tritici PST-78]